MACLQIENRAIGGVGHHALELAADNLLNSIYHRRQGPGIAHRRLALVAQNEQAGRFDDILHRVKRSIDLPLVPSERRIGIRKTDQDLVAIFAFIRGFYQDAKNLKPAVELLEQSKIYPLNGQATAKPRKFPDASGVPANMLPISDGSAFDQLKLLVESEGANLAESDWLGMLASLGIVKGQPYAPDAKTRAILDRAAKTAYKMSRVIGFEDVLNDGSLGVYADRRWVNPLDNVTPPGPRTNLDLSWKNVAGGYLDLDARIWFFTNYYSVSPGMLSKIPGKGACLHGRLHRCRGCTAVWRRQLSSEPAGQHPSRELLVRDPI